MGQILEEIIGRPLKRNSMKTDIGYISGPRWAGIGHYLKIAPFHFGVKIVITDHEKGFIMETYFIEVTGTQEQIDRFYKPILELTNHDK